MSASRTTSERPGIASIVHPAFIRDRLAPLFSPDQSAVSANARIEPARHNAGTFERLRSRVGAVVPSVGAPHPGAKGRVAFQVKRVGARAIYWYVDPAVARLRESILESVDVIESVAFGAAEDRAELAALRCEVDALRREVESLRRDLDRDVATRQAPAPSTGTA